MDAADFYPAAVWTNNVRICPPKKGLDASRESSSYQEMQAVTKSFRLPFAAALASTFVATVASAQIFGHTIDVQYIWPVTPTPQYDLGTITVSATPQTVTLQPYFDVTVSSSQIIINNSNYRGQYYGGNYNGEFLVDKTASTFPAVTIDPSSVFTGGKPTVTIVGNILEIDYDINGGLYFLPGDQLVLNVVPEPVGLGFIGAGLGLFGLLLRRRRVTPGKSSR